MSEEYCINCYFYDDCKNEQNRFYCENSGGWMDDYDHCGYWTQPENES